MAVCPYICNIHLNSGEGGYMQQNPATKNFDLHFSYVQLCYNGKLNSVSETFSTILETQMKANFR